MPHRIYEGFFFSYDHSLKDRLIQLGTGHGGAPILSLRLIEIKVGKTSYSYITSVLDPQILLFFCDFFADFQLILA
ncbi:MULTISPECIES: hypothetical protein [Nostoc]|uniref:Uncharacterized protein n=1 Tax=Nostoc paludosum FACHB-159 TaxID=2692908 RepID=A0ABR8K7V6_9NOSO|nr:MULTISPECIES: hypothetical protein [Nostoc]MBD2679180.1 hypothetical protein [Nostoc sp. FACHB-857]MBD2735561.1 hypothetical protein [Nostoc paludosum FACHB-159]